MLLLHGVLRSQTSLLTVFTKGKLGTRKMTRLIYIKVTFQRHSKFLTPVDHRTDDLSEPTGMTSLHEPLLIVSLRELRREPPD
jgi:hypothetical protein